MWFPRQLLAVLAWLVLFVLDAYVLMRLGKWREFESRARYLAFSTLLGVIAGTAYLLLGARSGSGILPVFFLALCGWTIVAIQASPYVDRFLHPEHGPIPAANKWALWPVTAPFVGGTLLAAAAVAIVRSFIC